MKTPKQWQEELQGELSVESIGQIQADARADLLIKIRDSINMLEVGEPATERVWAALAILHADSAGSPSGSGQPTAKKPACLVPVATKPPLGIMPERLFKELRAWDLIECIARNRQEPIDPGEWFDELRRLLNEGNLPSH